MARRRRVRKPKNSKTGNIVFGAMLIAVIVGGALFLFARSDGGTTTATNALGSIVTPIQAGVTRAATAIRNAFSGVGRYREMSVRNQEYQREIQELKLELSSLEEAARQNERLLSLLDVKDHLKDEKPVFALVIGRDPGVWFDMFTINRGTRHGVEVDMAVVNGDGLIGRVIEVGANFAKVQAITDSRSSVACLIERTRDNGIMRGTTDAASPVRECTMHYLQTVKDIVPGDRVITSGTDQIYPKGLTVGFVTAIGRDASAPDQRLFVTPSVNFLHIEEVMVLTRKVEGADEALPALPTSSPKPVPTMRPTPTPTAQTGQLSREHENEPWARPTPVADDQSVPNNAPRTRPTAVPDYLIPEDEWTQ